MATKELKIKDLKKAIHNYFNVSNTQELKQLKNFEMATDGIGKLDFRTKETWKKLYRKWIGILPDERDEHHYGCINGIDIFKYSRPWEIFNLDPKTSGPEDIKKAFRKLSKIYHPDIPKTGDRKIFERLTQMYNSVLPGVK